MLSSTMKRVVKLVVPHPRTTLNKLYCGSLDTVDWLLGRRDALTPPRRLQLIGAQGFHESGRTFFGYFVELGRLQPGDRVLDPGCGVGRMAVPLTGYLTTGSYEGFDIVPKAVRWCQKHITPKYPSFRFHIADVLNKGYNPKGKHDAADYRFPYPNESFDFVLLTSVFTHMLPAGMQNYLSEVSRVLKRGKRCLITYFLLNPESQALIAQGKSHFPFAYEYGSYRLNDAAVPEAAVAYEERYVLGLFQENGLALVPPVHYGSWCGRRACLDDQDIVVASKR